MDYEWWERKAIQETLDKIDQIEKDNRQLWDWCIELKKQFPKGKLMYKKKTDIEWEEYK